ncbi:MAG TPA: hypothetical protein ENK73_01535 [Thiomicrospira sp.]|jgi:hypothetical protein|nr:hypothetical protein [Thiomicrospira sp.]
MKPTLKKLFLICLATLPLTTVAKNNSDIEKNTHNTVYSFVNNLNSTLKSQLHSYNFKGIKHVSTIQKNKQIIVQVTHDPKTSYSNMIEGIAETAGRVNGINFQNSFTLDIINSYCKTDLFYTIQSHGLDKVVIVQYEDLRGNNIALHRINKQLCKL